MAAVVTLDPPLVSRLDALQRAKPSLSSRSAATRLALRLGLLELEKLTSADEALALLAAKEGPVK